MRAEKRPEWPFQFLSGQGFFLTDLAYFFLTKWLHLVLYTTQEGWQLIFFTSPTFQYFNSQVTRGFPKKMNEIFTWRVIKY